jgi:hypothetical protein
MSQWQVRISTLLILSLAPLQTLPAKAALSATAEIRTDVGLSLLSVKGRAPKTGYSRNQFGTAWSVSLKRLYEAKISSSAAS